VQLCTIKRPFIRAERTPWRSTQLILNTTQERIGVIENPARRSLTRIARAIASYAEVPLEEETIDLTQQ
jgi:hypothetical protein